MRMAQSIENLGGPGSQRARYVRAVMANPYNVSPMLPFMGANMGAPPPGYGDVHTTPTELEMRAGQPDPEMTALEQGITTTASAKIASAMGRSLATKLATVMSDGTIPAQYLFDQYYQQPQDYQQQYQEEIPQQYVRAMQPQYGQQSESQEPPMTHAQATGHHAVGALKGVGTALGESAMSAGHALAALGGGIGQGIGAAARAARGIMSREGTTTKRWGTGAMPATMTNEYGQPIYG